MHQPIPFSDLFGRQQWCPWKYLVKRLEISKTTGLPKKRKLPISKRKLNDPNPRVGEVGIKFFQSGHYWDYADAVDFCRNYAARRKYKAKKKKILPLLLDNGKPQLGFCLPFVPCGIVVLDIDDCYDVTGKLNPAVAKFTGRINSYAERSPSGTGYRAFILGSAPFTKTVMQHPDGFKIEVFAANSWATVTGDRLSVSDCICEEPGILSELIAIHLAKKPAALKRISLSKAPKQSSNQQSNQQVVQIAPPMLIDDDRTLIDEIQTSRRGQKFIDLWSNDKSLRTDEYELPSRFHAVRSLVRILAFWSRKDQAQIYRIMQHCPVITEAVSKRWRSPKELPSLISKECKRITRVRRHKKPMLNRILTQVDLDGGASLNEIWEVMRQQHYSKPIIQEALRFLSEHGVIRQAVSKKIGRPTIRWETIPEGEF